MHTNHLFEKARVFALAGITYLAGAVAQAQTTYEAWKIVNFNATEQANDAVSGLLATPRDDGFPNLVKYALGLDVDELPDKPVPEIVGTDPLSVRFDRPVGLSDVTYVVQFTSDLTGNGWVSGSTSVTANGATETVTAADPLATAAPLRFSRLRFRHSSGVEVGAPTNLTATADSSTEATLTFDEVPGAKGYLVEAMNPQGEFDVVGFVNAGNNSYSVGGIIPERAATFRVRAIKDNDGVTEASETASVTTEFGDQGSLVVRHSILTQALDQQRNVFILLFENNSSEAVKMNEFAIRRWMKKEGDVVQTNYYYVGGNPSVSNGDDTVNITVVDLPFTTETADSYAEFDFSGLADSVTVPGNGGTFRLSGQIYIGDNAPRFIASNDYSTILQENGGDETPVNGLCGLYRDVNGDGDFTDDERIFGLPPGGGDPNGPKRPIALRARPMSESSIELVWEDEGNNEALYVIERDFSEDSDGFSILTTVEANTLAFEDQQLLDEAQYTYRVRAVNQSGASALTNTATTETLPGTSPQFIPVSPATVDVATFSDGRLDLDWADSSRNERGFIIERRESGGSFEEIARVDRGITSYVDFGLEASTSYEYRIKAFNLAGEAASSTEAGTTSSPQSAPALTDAEVARFLRQAAFGATPALIAEVKAKGFETWLDEQFDASVTTPSLHEADTLAAIAGRDLTTPEGAEAAQGDRQNVWWDHVLTAPDQARQRLAFALSQIIVISQNDPDLTPEPRAMAKFYDLFVNAPESNFRELLEDVSLSPVMGNYLDHTRNQKANATTGVRPDENYAREIMQLFSIGLLQLNLDGTPKLDGDGIPIPTYSQDDIVQVAKVFTGLTFASPGDFFTNAEDFLNPMRMDATYHETERKDFTLLNSDGSGGTAIPDIPADGDPLDDLEKIHDGLANHPSCAPFICRQLIQRTVTSNPSPAYVERVSQVFENNGQGQRGDLAAVFKAIVLDYEARSLDPRDSLIYGKQREPIIRLATLLRALNATPGANGVTIGDLTLLIQQAPLRAPSVFNFFEPGFSLPGAINDQGLDSPEFQTSQSSTVLQTINVAGDIIYEGNFGGLNRDFSRYSDSSLSVDDLLDRLEDDLLDGRMPTAMRMVIGDHLTGITDLEDRAKAGLYLVVSSAEFNIEQ